MDEIFPDKRNLIGLVEQASEGKLCLPEFQRDFVWTRNEVADLIRSVLRGYYIGSLLLLRCDPNRPPFEPVLLRGARPMLRQPRPEFLVLDGQQRLTSLLYALTAPDLPLKDSSQPRRFFINLDLLLRDQEDDEIVFDLAPRELDGLDRREVQYVRRVLPCPVLLRANDFLTWRDGLDDWLRAHEPENHGRFRKEWRPAWSNAVGRFQTFSVPLVELPAVREDDEGSIGRVSAIFEKLNSTGVELSVYDLLTARLYRNGIRLHQLWDEACRDHKRLAEWSGGKADTAKFGVLVLRTLALLRGLDPKPRVLINLRPDGFEADWRRAAGAMERALDLVEHVGPDGFGVFERKWLSVTGLLPVLAALRAEIEARRLGEGPRADLRRWYWCNVFLERYSSAVESKSRKDYAELLAYWTGGGPEPSVFAEARARIGAEGYTIHDSASVASAVYSGVFALLALQGARDWVFGEEIRLQELEDHHVFPQAYLRRHGVTRRVDVNSIANRTLISGRTNRLIRDRAPAAYLGDPQVFPSGAAEAVVGPHFVTAEALEAMRRATENLPDAEVVEVFSAFKAARERAIVRRIREVCGIPERAG
jgi:hypothetical protein